MTGIWEQEEGEARGTDSKFPAERQLKGLRVVGSGSQFLPRGLGRTLKPPGPGEKPEASLWGEAGRQGNIIFRVLRAPERESRQPRAAHPHCQGPCEHHLRGPYTPPNQPTPHHLHLGSAPTLLRQVDLHIHLRHQYTPRAEVGDPPNLDRGPGRPAARSFSPECTVHALQPGPTTHMFTQAHKCAHAPSYLHTKPTHVPSTPPNTQNPACSGRGGLQPPQGGRRWPMSPSLPRPSPRSHRSFLPAVAPKQSPPRPLGASLPDTFS